MLPDVAVRLWGSDAYRFICRYRYRRIKQRHGQDGTVFTGPYAQQIKRTYDNAHQSLTKKILKDSKITDQEFLELSQHFRSDIVRNSKMSKSPSIHKAACQPRIRRE